MTATERVLKGSDDRVLSMDDPKVYGEVAFSYTFKQAIADGVICDYKVITLTVSETRMRELISANKHLRLHGLGKEDRLRLAQDLAAGELLAKAQSEHGVRHAISFHRSISAASAFADQWESVDQMVKRRVRSTAFHVSSKVPTGRRVELLRDFRESPSAVITNARCLTEGVDVPNVDAVLFADPRRSTIDIVQAVGRALRKNRDKPEKIGYVLLPVLVEDGQTVDDFLQSSAFKEVGRVLAVLSTHDERIAEEFRAVEGGGQRSLRESRIVFGGDVPVGVRLSAQEFAERCGARVWQRVAKVNWRTFSEARSFAQSLGLCNTAEWNRYRASGVPGKAARPADIPTNPQRVYNESGWAGWGDWLGTQRLANSSRSWREFTEARAFVRQLGLRNQGEWRDYCRGRVGCRVPLPQDIPSTPSRSYAGKGWKNMSDWLGNGFIHYKERRYRPFSEAREFSRNLGLDSLKEWKDYCSGRRTDLPPKPSDVPRRPDLRYQDSGWIGFGDWLGTGRRRLSRRQGGRETWRPFGEAKRFVASLCLKSSADWYEYCSSGIEGKPPRPDDIPSNPKRVYKNFGWSGMGDWLGTGTIATYERRYRTLSEARQFVHSLGLKNHREWRAYCGGKFKGKPALPADVPRAPHHHYRHQGWIGYGDWLGTGHLGTSNRQWRDFAKARRFVRRLRLANFSEWRAYCRGEFPDLPRRPVDVPTTPPRTYVGEGWSGWSDWLGTDRKPRRPKSRKP
jgi:hypothetical protein